MTHTVQGGTSKAELVGYAAGMHEVQSQKCFLTCGGRSSTRVPGKQEMCMSVPLRVHGMSLMVRNGIVDM